MILCAGNGETFPFATPIGVGLVESAINLTRLALFDKPEFMVFIGSAGSYGGYEIFDIVESKIASNVEQSFLSKDSYTPLDNVIEAYSDEKNEIVSHKTIVNSGNYITTNIQNAKAFRGLGLELENMEFFSLLRVAQEFEIPVLGIFVVTNYCNENAHHDFVKNHDKAMKKLTEYMVKKYGVNG